MPESTWYTSLVLSRNADLVAKSDQSTANLGGEVEAGGAFAAGGGFLAAGTLTGGDFAADAAAVRDAGGGGLATGFAAAAGGGIAGSFGVEELDATPLLSIGILL